MRRNLFLAFGFCLVIAPAMRRILNLADTVPAKLCGLVFCGCVASAIAVCAFHGLPGRDI